MSSPSLPEDQTGADGRNPREFTEAEDDEYVDAVAWALASVGCGVRRHHDPSDWDYAVADTVVGMLRTDGYAVVRECGVTIPEPMTWNPARTILRPSPPVIDLEGNPEAKERQN